MINCEHSWKVVKTRGQFAQILGYCQNHDRCSIVTDVNCDLKDEYKCSNINPEVTKNIRPKWDNEATFDEIEGMGHRTPLDVFINMYNKHA